MKRGIPHKDSHFYLCIHSGYLHYNTALNGHIIQSLFLIRPLLFKYLQSNIPDSSFHILKPFSCITVIRFSHIIIKCIVYFVSTTNKPQAALMAAWGCVISNKLHILKCLGCSCFHSLLICFLDLQVHFLTIDGDLLGCAYAYLDLISAYIQYRYFYIIIDDQRFIFFSRQCQHNHSPALSAFSLAALSIS